MIPCLTASFFFFFNDTATTEIYTLSLHDALPISLPPPVIRIRSTYPLPRPVSVPKRMAEVSFQIREWSPELTCRSEEHTSELQSQSNLVCRLLLEKKKNKLYHQSY